MDSSYLFLLSYQFATRELGYTRQDRVERAQPASEWWERGRRRRMGGGGYGSIVDAGSVLLALTPSAQLVVFEPTDKEFKQIASYKVAESQTYAYPIIAGNRIFVKDKDSFILWMIE